MFIHVRGKCVCSCPVGNALSTALPSTTNHLLTSRGRATRRTAVISLVQGSLDRVTARIYIPHCHCLRALRARYKPLLRVDSRMQKHLPRGCLRCLKAFFFHLLPTKSIAKTPGGGAISVVRRTRAKRHKFCAKITK